MGISNASPLVRRTLLGIQPAALLQRVARTARPQQLQLDQLSIIPVISTEGLTSIIILSMVLASRSSASDKVNCVARVSGGQR